MEGFILLQAFILFATAPVVVWINLVSFYYRKHRDGEAYFSRERYMTAAYVTFAGYILIAATLGDKYRLFDMGSSEGLGAHTLAYLIYSFAGSLILAGVCKLYSIIKYWEDKETKEAVKTHHFYYVFSHVVAVVAPVFFTWFFYSVS